MKKKYPVKIKNEENIDVINHFNNSINDVE